MAPAAGGVFSANPLSLSVPEPEFESWLRETGFLELLDERASKPNSKLPFCSNSSSSPSPDVGSSSFSPKSPSLISIFPTLVSILTVNPFAKLNSDDFSTATPPWTVGFLTSSQGSSYSWPGGPSIARMRVQENVKRYARNYASLCLIILACTLYKMPMALLGLILSLAMWEVLWFGIGFWDPEEKYPGVRFAFIRVAQIATAAVLYFCHLQVAIFCAISISYAVMILHASLRKLSSSSKPLTGTGRQKSSQRMS
ncbi:prenylated RAB acceptor 1.H [Wolffia australiana]